MTSQKRRITIAEQKRIRAGIKRKTRPLLAVLSVPRIATRVRKARCYELSGRAIVEAGAATKWRLVHGTITAKEGLVGHAWLQRGQWIYDPDCLLTRPLFDLLQCGAKALRRYTVRQAAGMMRLRGHFGPWIEMPAEVIHKEQRGPGSRRAFEAGQEKSVPA